MIKQGFFVFNMKEEDRGSKYKDKTNLMLNETGWIHVIIIKDCYVILACY